MIIDLTKMKNSGPPMWFSLPGSIWKKTTRSNEEKEAVISHALSTEYGRNVLANCMVEPIRTGLEYR